MGRTYATTAWLFLLSSSVWAGRPELVLGRTDLADVVDARLDEEIGLLETLLDGLVDQYDCDQSPELRHRLADLRWEKSKRLFFRLEASDTSDAEGTDLGRAMRAQRQKSLAGYADLLADCPAHAATGHVRFLLGSALVEVDRVDEAAVQFRTIIRAGSPDSPWLGNAWLMLGLYFFDHKNDAASARQAFERAEERGDPLTRVYARFMRGWCAVNEGAWPQALQHFERVVRGDAVAGSTGAALRREALGDYVRALSQVADPERAQAALVDLVGREQTPALMEKLAAWYTEAGAHHRVVRVYRQLIEQQPTSIRLPVYWSRLVETLAVVDRIAATAHAADLATAFVDTRARARTSEAAQQRQAARHLVEAAEVAERSVRQLASSHHRDAIELHGRGKRHMLRTALVFYDLYLELFGRPEPGEETNVGVRMRFNRAEALAAVSDDRAVEAYEGVIALAGSADGPKAREAESVAIEATVHLLRERVRAEARTAADRSQLSTNEQHLIRAGGRYVGHFGFDRPESIAVHYLVGYLHYDHGQTEEALPIFEAVVLRAPAHEKACHAANLILDIHNGKSDWRRLRDAARSLRKNRALGCTAAERQEFLVVEQTAAFNLIEVEWVAVHEHLEAARAYEAFARRYPRSHLAGEALLAAGANYDRAGRPREAVAAWRTLAASTYADEAQVREAMFATTQLFERTVQFVEAAQELERFASRFSEDPRSRDALYNAAIYRAKLGQVDRARRDRRMFVSRYPNDPAAPVLALELCQWLADDSRAADAAECFATFASDARWRRHRDAVCVARTARARLLDELGYTGTAARQRTRLLRDWNAARRDGANLPRCTRAVAELKLHRMAIELARYRELTIADFDAVNPDARRRFYDSVRTKARRRDALVARYERIVQLGEPEWALAALYYIGETYRDAAEKTHRAWIPFEVDGVPLPEDLREQLRAKRAEIAAPSESSAVEVYAACVREAERLAVYGSWRVKAQARLRELQPFEFRAAEARLVAMHFEDRLRVVENGMVIPDNGGWRGIEVELAP